MMQDIQKTEFVTFVKTKNPKKKTFDVEIWSSDGETKLGRINWHPGWRRYTLKIDRVAHHQDTLVFDSKCLRAITSYIDHLMNERDKRGGIRL